jgi:pimeloyl-ACP methyl ester carboxylesterase
VLVVHGIGGGYDQGLYIGQIGLESYQLISISRFGYLGTPLPGDATPAAQADAHAALLDALGVPQAAIVGISAGGPSSLQFALRFPERCAALVMVSAVNYEAPAHLLKLGERLQRLIHSDFMGWVVVRYARTFLLNIFGVSRRILEGLPAVEKQWVEQFFESILPLHWRADGIINDIYQIASLERLPLERINAPTLVIHADDDTTVSPDQGRYSAKSIPQARFVQLNSGGHFLLGQHQRVCSEVESFLNEHLD